MSHQVNTPLGDHTLSFETGKMAKQANGAVYARFGDTVVLATACSGDPRPGINFFPLTVDYREYQSSVGRIPGGFFKREGRPSEKEIITCRLTDRPIRPLFPDGYQDQVHVVVMVLSADQDNDPDVLGVTAAATALFISDIPFHTPLAAVRVGLVDGRLVTNPTYEEQRASLLNMVVAATEEAIAMVEAGAQGVSEETVNDALQYAHGEIKKIIAIQKELAAQLNVKKKEFTSPVLDDVLLREVQGKIGDSLKEAMDTSGCSKLEGEQKVKAVREELLNGYSPEDEEKLKGATRCFYEIESRIFRDNILNAKRRQDGRAFDVVRPITAEVGVLPRTHGSALFTRGETQALVNATLGASLDRQRMDVLEGETFKQFMLHYNFPPFSVGEAGFLRGPGRREIGHGALAEKALAAVMPVDEDFPYTVRAVSDILESNGSSSMATVCGACMALMDAGVPIKSPVAGIAMGLVLEGDKYSILTDIAGVEDHVGDMDFKVAGTREGITALQMDIKVKGVTSKIMAEALEQAKVARLHVLDEMLATLPETRKDISPYAPRIITVQINKEKIGDLIGPGGKIIRSIVEQTGAKIDVDDDGCVKVYTVDGEAAKRAVKMIEDRTASPELNKTYLGKVVRLADFGAFIEIFPGTDGLLHISEVAEHRIQDIRKELKNGDQLMVKVISIDGNKVRLSRKAVLRDQRQETSK